MLYDCVSEFVTLGVCVLSLLVVGTGWCRYVWCVHGVCDILCFHGITNLSIHHV